MSVVIWIGCFAVNSLWWIWIISWGGAERIEGWRSLFFLGWFSLDWNAQQIRFYAQVCWFLSAIWFVVGLIKPAARVIV